jgi:hypothetical protein
MHTIGATEYLAGFPTRSTDSWRDIAHAALRLIATWRARGGAAASAGLARRPPAARYRDHPRPGRARVQQAVLAVTIEGVIEQGGRSRCKPPSQMGGVPARMGRPQGGQGNGQLAYDARRLEYKSSVAIKMIRKAALDETRSEAAPGGLRDGRATLLSPCQREPLRPFVNRPRDFDVPGRGRQRPVLGRVRA